MIMKSLPYEVSASVWKTLCKGGKYITSICPTMESVTATRNIRLENSPMVKTDFVYKHGTSLYS